MPLLTAGIVAGVNLISGFLGMGAAASAARKAAAEKARLTRKLNYLENNRQAIINPFSGVKSLGNLAVDLSSSLTNPMANLGVATQAAEMQIEQADISLANTLDTIRSTGASAGGATALAQAALQSKKGVSAGIEQQEAQNEKLRAQGEQQLQSQRMQEQARIQGIKISEGGRAQNAQASGQAFKFNAQENRTDAKMDRLSAGISGAAGAEMQANSDYMGSLTGAISGAASAFGSLSGSSGGSGYTPDFAGAATNGAADAIATAASANTSSAFSYTPTSSIIPISTTSFTG
jgi:hypothetical protein